MAISSLKRFRSYFQSQIIATGTSAYHPILYLELHRGRLQLSTPDAIYSFDDLYTPAKLGLAAIVEQLPRTGNGLLLGYGLGSMAVILKKHYPQLCYDLTGVERDEQIAGWANEYKPSNYPASITVIEADAADFVADCTEQYHLVFVDLFVDQQVAVHFRAAAFLVKCKQLLKPNGHLIYNIIPSANDSAASEFESLFSTCFPQHTKIANYPNEIWIGMAAN